MATNNDSYGLQIVEDAYNMSGGKERKVEATTEQIFNNMYGRYKIHEEIMKLDNENIITGINSGYRTEATNKAVGGVYMSGHTLGLALDYNVEESKIIGIEGVELLNNIGGTVGNNISEAFLEQNNTKWVHIASKDNIEGGSNVFKTHSNVGFIQTNKNNVCGISTPSCPLTETKVELYDAFISGDKDLKTKYEHVDSFKPKYDSVGSNMGDIMLGMQEEYNNMVERYKNKVIEQNRIANEEKEQANKIDNKEEV